MPSSGVQTCALDRKSTRLNSSHTIISYAVFCLKKKNEGRYGAAGIRSQAAHPITPSPAAAPACPGLPLPMLPVPLPPLCLPLPFFFFFNETATPEISPLPLPAALPILRPAHPPRDRLGPRLPADRVEVVQD